MGHPQTQEELIRSLKKGTATKRTICEVFREMQDMVEQMNGQDTLLALILEGFGYAKKMDHKLRGYKWTVENKNFSKNYAFRKAK